MPAEPPREGNDKKSAAMRLLDLVEAVLDEHKAEDVVVIDLDGKTPMADYMVVASGRSQRQVQALADYVARAVKGMAVGLRMEGQTQGDWILIDAGDVLVHLFRPEVREFYRVEAMWGYTTPSSASAGPGPFFS